MKNWFEVSTKGLKVLQAGKPKHHIIRELIQNAWDENTTHCNVNLSYNKGLAEISVIDNNPEGFKDLADAYTLFKETQKRPNPIKRGRFNIGEKQAIALSEKAKIITTKGTIVFDKSGRRKSGIKRSSGSEVILWVKMNQKEFNEMTEVLKKYIPPKEIRFTINSEDYKSRIPEKIIEASLETEIEENEIMKRVQRKTEIWVYKKVFDPMLYEMGIPVCEIDCSFDVNIQQRIPLSIDRETISQKYLSNIYAEVLNETYEDIEKENSSDIWVREALSNKRIKSEAVKEIIKKRFGEKSCVANPFDPNSIDDAISKGFNVVYGSELSKNEWSNIKENNALQSSTELFGKDFVGAEEIEPTKEMLKVKKLSQKIAKRLLKIDLSVVFIKSKATCGADFGNNTLTFNVSRLGKHFWEYPISKEVIGLIVHELGHLKGNHTEMSYHKCLTDIAGELTIIALKEPNFFEL